MFKKLALILCTSTFLRASCSLEKATISSSFTISVAKSSTVSFDGHLYTVSKNSSHIHVNSTDNNYKTCDIAINSVKDHTQGSLEVTSTDEEIFVVGVQSVRETRNRQLNEYNEHKYTILRVDPRACSYQSAFIPEVNDHYNANSEFPKPVRHNTSIDVFFSGLQQCAPCRFDNAGLRIAESTPQIQRENNPPGDLVTHDVQFIKSMNAYLYVYNSYSFSGGVETTKIKLLDEKDFSIKVERISDFPIHAIAQPKKTKGYLGVCTKTLDRRVVDGLFYTKIRCDRLNSNLDVMNTIQIPIESELSTISYEFDEEDNSYISFAQQTKLQLYIHDKDGKLIKAFNMGEIDDKFQQYPPYNPITFSPYIYWDVNGFLVGDQYCIVTKQSDHRYSTPLQHVRCVDLTKYIKS